MSWLLIRFNALKFVHENFDISIGPYIQVKPRHHPYYKFCKLFCIYLGTLKKKPKPKIKLTVSAKGVPQRKLQLVKTPRSNLPRHPMPFAAKNMYYDERWIEKQEEGNMCYLIPRGLPYHVKHLYLPLFMTIVLTKKWLMSGDKM